MSREAAFLVNNWILLFSAFFVLFATMFPTLSEAVTGERLTVGGAVLQQVDGADRPHPAVADRRRAAAGVAQVDARQPARSVPVAGASRRSSPAARCVGARLPRLGVGPVLRAVRVRRRHDRPGVLARRAASGSSNTGTDLFTAIIGLVGRNKRRYGGYIVHVGIVLIFLGFAGNGCKLDEQVLLKPGQQTTIGRYTIRNDGVKVTDDGQKQMITGVPGGLRRRQADRRRCIRRSGASASTRRADDRGRDPADARRGSVRRARRLRRSATQSATLQIVVNPLVNWIWFGFGIMALGTGIALLPERAFSFALAKLPAEAAATTVALLLLRAAVRRHDAVGAARHGRRRRTRRRRSTRATPFEKQMQHEIVCTCGACGHADDRRVPQGSAAARRTRCAASSPR